MANAGKRRAPARPRRKNGRGGRGDSNRRRRGFGWKGWLWRLALIALVVGGGYVAWLDHEVTSAFEGKRWALPARVYARPLELYPGLHLRPASFKKELAAADYTPVENASEPGLYSREGDEFRLRTRDFQFWDGHEPSHHVSVRFDAGRVSAIRDLDSGHALNLVRLDPAHIGNIYPAQHEDRDLVRLKDVPRPLVKALISVEDRRFMEHHGISLIGIARAMIANIRAGHVVEGGSTITQQLVKNFFLSNERTLWRKANEAVMALLLEAHYDKAEILQAYINEVYLGQDGDRAIHGFGLASRFYFGQPLDRISLAQQALLVGLVKGPSYYDPRRHPDRARERRRLVLKVMADQGFLDQTAARRAADRPLGVVPRPNPANTRFPAFMDLVRRHLDRDYRSSDLTTEGLRIFTTLAPSVQYSAEEAVSERASHWSNGTQSAVVSVDVDNGEVEAVVGGRDPRYAGFNRALDARRPVGSLIKPAIYLTALAHPDRYGLGTILEDKPVTLKDAAGNTWHPQNYDRKYHGKVPLWAALAHSYNVPTVRLGLDLGLRAIADSVKRLGAQVPDTVYPSMLLGAIDESPLDMARMYETLAAGGFRTPLRAVRAVMTPEGKVLSRYDLSVDRVFDPGEVFLVNDALRQVVRQGTAQGLSRWVSPDLHVAGKTGTTDDLRDSWFAGFTGDTLAVVWVGRDDNGRTGLTGASGAMTVWGAMFSRLEPKPLNIKPPEDVRPLWIDSGTGLLAAAHCEGAVRLPYLKGSAPDAKADCVDTRSAVERAGDWVKGWFH